MAADIDITVKASEWLACETRIVTLTADLARVTAERDALRAAFDWLEAHVFERKWNGVMGNGSRMNWNLAGPWRHIVQRLHGDTLPAAIDAARKEQG